MTAIPPGLFPFISIFILTVSKAYIRLTLSPSWRKYRRTYMTMQIVLTTHQRNNSRKWCNFLNDSCKWCWVNTWRVSASQLTDNASEKSEDDQIRCDRPTLHPPTGRSQTRLPVKLQLTAVERVYHKGMINKLPASPGEEASDICTLRNLRRGEKWRIEAHQITGLTEPYLDHLLEDSERVSQIFNYYTEARTAIF